VEARPPAAGLLRWVGGAAHAGLVVAVLAPARAADLRSKAGDDTAAKVCLSFDLPLDQVPFLERQAAALARARSGEPCPRHAVLGVGRAEAVGSLIDNAYSRRVRYIVLRNAADAAERWVDERRDVAADFRRAFGDEAPSCRR
jgi:hypothetical protein